jgi:hypothetical protein
LGGSHHTSADRELAEQFLVCAPHLPYLVRTHRVFLRRVVRHLVGAGVRQFLDLGSGLPTMDNVHQVAQHLDPTSRVVYVDVDPVVGAESRGLLGDTPNTAYVCADLTEPEQVLGDRDLRRLLNPDEPVAVLMVDVLHCIPDSARPAELIATYLDAFPRGSYVAISHTCRDEGLLAAVSMFSRLYGAEVPEFTFRYPLEVVDLLEGLDIVDPGVVPLPLWRPEQDEGHDRYPEHFQGCGAVGRTP